MYPVHIKIETAVFFFESFNRKKKEEAEKIEIEKEGPPVEIPPKKEQKSIIDVLTDEFCFFQLPANLPMEGCYQETPKTEDPDYDLYNKDILSAFLEKKFDATGFFLEREFKLFEKKAENIKAPPKKNSTDITFTDAELTHDTISIGKLCKLKDGSLKLRIGENYFDLIDGVQDNFYKDLFAIDYDKKAALNLLPIEKKFIIKPDLEGYLV